MVVDGWIQNRGETTGMLMGQKKKRGERHTNITETNQCSGYEKTNERWNIGGCESCNRTFQSEEGRKVNINGEVLCGRIFIQPLRELYSLSYSSQLTV